MAEPRTRTDSGQLFEFTRFKESSVKTIYPPWPSSTSEETTTYGTSFKENYTKSMTDIVTKNFYKLSRQGKIINNPMSKTATRVFDEPYEENYYLSFARYTGGGSTGWKTTNESYRVIGSSKDYLESLYPDITKGLEGDPIFIESLKNQAVTSAWANMDQSEMMALSTLAELDDSVKFLIDTMKRVVQITRDLRKLKSGKYFAGKRAKKRLKDQVSFKELADRYMEMRYSLRPMVYDVIQISNAINKALDEKSKPMRFTSRGFASDTDFKSEIKVYDTSSQTNLGWHTHRVTIESTRSEHVEVRSGVLSSLEYVSNLNIFGFDSVLETGWDLLPLSFVVDWFFNVGETIASFTPEVGVKALASWVVTNCRTTRTIRVSSFEDSYDGNTAQYYKLYGYNRSLTNCSYIEHEDSYGRTPNPSRSVIPSFSLNLNALKLIDLAVIGRNLLR